MAKSKRVSFEPARYIGLNIRRASELADLQFAKLDSAALTVTIPARQLSRIYAEIDRKLQKAPELDARVSKKKT